MEQQITQPTQQAPNGSIPGGYQQIIINQQESKKNGIGTAGFVLALLAFLFCWVPVLDIILWILGAIFSLIISQSAGDRHLLAPVEVQAVVVQNDSGGVVLDVIVASALIGYNAGDRKSVV